MIGASKARLPSISTIASPQPHIFTINDDSNEPTLPFGFGRQLPIVPPSLNDLNLPPNPFNISMTMAVVHQTQNTHDDNTHMYHLYICLPVNWEKAIIVFCFVQSEIFEDWNEYCVSQMLQVKRRMKWWNCEMKCSKCSVK